MSIHCRMPRATTQCQRQNRPRQPSNQPRPRRRVKQRPKSLKLRPTPAKKSSKRKWKCRPKKRPSQKWSPHRCPRQPNRRRLPLPRLLRSRQLRWHQRHQRQWLHIMQLLPALRQPVRPVQRQLQAPRFQASKRRLPLLQASRQHRLRPRPKPAAPR